jgi:hypothetical protein
MPRGGDTRAAAAAHGKKVGRPKKPKAPPIPKSVAIEVMADQRARIKERLINLLEFAEKADRRLEWVIVNKVIERAEGLPVRMEGELALPNPAAFGLRVTIEHIGRPHDQAAAEAKFAGATLE